jgi:hypothetical protein
MTPPQPSPKGEGGVSPFGGSKGGFVALLAMTREVEYINTSLIFIMSIRFATINIISIFIVK